MADYTTISEIVNEQTGDVRPPLEEWEIEVVERGLEENFGDIGGREDFVANARVQVTEPDGSSWTGLTHVTD